ncbi:hypothetical protein FO519_010381, partial [Halicephalobus sp. NKZ332]
YFDKDYGKDHALIPHGLSVVVTAPADFIFTASASPEKHLEAANLLGANLSSTATSDEIGNTLADILRGFMKDFNCPNGLSEMGFDKSNVEDLSNAAIGFIKANAITPKDSDLESLARIYESSLTVY